MSVFDPISKAIETFNAKIEATAQMLDEADADTLDEKTRGSALNRQRHPVGSTTPLPTAERLALKVLARLETEYGPIYQQAMVGLLAQHQAERNLQRIQEARKAVKAASIGPNDFPPETCAAIGELKELGVDKWHWRNQSRRQLQLIADLLRWHAKDPSRNDPDNPWRLLDPVYAGRSLAEGKLFRPIQTEVSVDVSTGRREVETPSLTVPSRPELRAFLAEEVLMAPEEFDSTMGGVISFAGPGVEHLPMWEREGRPTVGVTATTADRYRIEAPRGPYLLLHRPGQGTIFSDPKPGWLPPYKQLRQLGVEACMTPAEVDRLQDLSETGKGSVELALKAILHFTTRVGLGEVPQEHLTRFWLYLLVGRHHPAEIESLGPNGYFHGIHGPDPANHDGHRGLLMIVRATASDDNSLQIWPHLQTPWVRGWRPDDS